MMRKLLLLLCAGLFVATAYAMEGATSAATKAITELKTNVNKAVADLVDRIKLAGEKICKAEQTTATAEVTKAKDEAKTQVDAAMKAIEDITKALTDAQKDITESINNMEKPETPAAG